MSTNSVEQMAPSMPIWYIVSRREAMYPYSNWGVRHVIFCIPCDFGDMPAMWERLVRPLNEMGIAGVEIQIFSRNPVEFAVMTDSAQARDEQELAALINRAHDIEYRRRKGVAEKVELPTAESENE